MPADEHLLEGLKSKKGLAELGISAPKEKPKPEETPKEEPQVEPKKEKKEKKEKKKAKQESSSEEETESSEDEKDPKKRKGRKKKSRSEADEREEKTLAMYMAQGIGNMMHGKKEGEEEDDSGSNFLEKGMHFFGGMVDAMAAIPDKIMEKEDGGRANKTQVVRIVGHLDQGAALAQHADSLTPMNVVQSGQDISHPWS